MAYRAFCVGIDALSLKHSFAGTQRLAECLRQNSYTAVVPPNAKGELTEAFDAFTDQVNEADTAILYLSGHGLMTRGKLYLILGDDTSKHGNLLNVNVWLDQFSESKAKNKLVILDCCHAMKGVDELVLDCQERMVILTSSGKLEQSYEFDSMGSFFTTQLCSIFENYVQNNTDASALDIGTLRRVLVERTKTFNLSSEIELPIPRIVGAHINFPIFEPLNQEKLEELLKDKNAQKIEQIEKDYRELLLKNCDIVSLNNLPGQDRHILLRALELRRLYVPLRVWLDVKTTDEAKDSDWENVEQRRQVSNGFQSHPIRSNSAKDRTAIGPRLSESKKVVVLGDPGSGKTTLIRWLATAYLLRSKSSQAWQDLPDVKTLPDSDLLPIVVRCRDLDKAATFHTLDEILEHTLRKSETAPDRISALREILRSRMGSGNALFMLDGLDEIADPVRRAELCSQVEQIHLAFPKTTILVTSRIVGYREMGRRFGRGFEHVTLADLTPLEKDDFAKRWCELTEPPSQAKTSASSLIDDVHSNDRIERMTGNPMLLTTMALVKRKVGKLPNRRADLYSEAVQVLLNWRSDLGQKIDAYEALPQLEYIAYAMCMRGVQRLRRSEMLQLLNEVRADFPNVHMIKNHKPEDFLALMEANTGLIVEAGREKNLGTEELVYEFRHLTFQEYLAACSLVRGHFQGRRSGSTLAQNVAPLAACTAELALVQDGEKEVAVAENWREVLRLVATICHDDDLHDFLTAILEPCEGEKTASGRARAILAVLCVADEPNVSEALVKNIFERFSLQIDERDRNIEIRTGVHVAALAISRTRWSAILIDTLVSKFASLPPLTRDFTGDIVGVVVANELLGDQKVLAKWWRAQVNTLRNATEHAAITSALGIASVAMTSRKAEFSNEMIEALIGRLHGTAPMAHAAAQALANLTWAGKNKAWDPTDRDLKLFLGILDDPRTDPEVVRFLVQIAGYERIPNSVSTIKYWLQNSNAELRRVIVSALADFQVTGATVAIAESIFDPAAEVRERVVFELSAINAKKYEKLFLNALRDENKDVRSTAIVALSKSNSSVPITELAALLADNDSDVRGNAAHALGLIGKSNALPYLQRTLSDEDPYVRLAAVRSVGKIGGQSACRMLMRLIDHNDLETRQEAIRGLGSSSSRKVTDVLLEMLRVPSVAPMAAESLGKIGGNRVFQAMMDAFEDADYELRTSLVRSITKMNVQPTSSVLLDMIKSENSKLKCAAAELFGRLKIQISVSILLKELKSDDPDVRRSISYALGMLGNSRSVDALLDELTRESDDHDVTILALAKTGSKRAIPKLTAIAMAMNDDELGQIAAIEAIGRIGGHRAERTLTKLLRSPSDFIRCCAAEGLSFALDSQSRRLMTQNLDGKWPFIDPAAVITRYSVRVAALHLGIGIEDLISKFEALQARFKLKFAWKT